MSERQTGYILLVSGIAIMIVSLITVILLFTGRIQPIKLFNIPAPTINPASFLPSVPNLPKATSSNIELIPTEGFNKILNLSTQFILMTFIMSFGFKLGDLGVKLLRPIKIESK